MASNRKVFYRTRANGNIRWFSLTDFDFSPSPVPAFLDINARGAESVAADFGELTAAQHRDYLYAFFRKKDLKQAMGDLVPMTQGLLKTLEGYRPQVQP